MLMNMKDLLKVANKHNFAVPAFNIGTGQILNGVMDTCERLKAPVILAIHPKELHFQGASFIKMCIDRANKSPLPVVIHLDHSDWGPICEAIQAGFTSVMIDASALPFEENIAITKKVCELAHPLGVSVEGELGTIGTADGFEGGMDHILYTRPEDAVRFVAETGVDCLAIAIGTSHGLYPKGMQPKLKQDLLSEIKSQLPDTPLVLHGGSGNSDEEIAEAVKRGVNKINISSDIKDAFYKKLRVILEDQKLREPFELYPDAVAAMNEVVEHKVRLFNDDDKVRYYLPDEML